MAGPDVYTGSGYCLDKYKNTTTYSNVRILGTYFTETYVNYT